MIRGLLPLLLLLAGGLALAQGRRDPWERMRQYDLDGDGRVSRDEFAGPSRVFDRLDSDGDGYVTEAEARRMRPEGASTRAFDIDRDGRVTLEEWESFFRKADENGDEILQPEELEAALRGQRMRDAAPAVGDAAPPGKAKTLKDGKEVDLSKPRRATVLVFGSWT